ncbi:MAG: dihydropteroate synthase [Proteobacteria bacterium]|nr:dihydropteroate synthase [Pseudomonadota bacterium]
MGVINVTPDSFSDGGQYLSTGAAVAHGLRLAAQGADMLDVGGESTRPGAAPVNEAEECARVLPVIEALAGQTDLPISVDTARSGVAAKALAHGAAIVNDVTGFQGDPRMAAVAAAHEAGVVLMHLQGGPQTMQHDPTYADLLYEVTDYWRRSLRLAAEAGIAADRILLDPGIGFGKTLAHNLELLRRLPELASLGHGLLLGTSRKSFIKITLKFDGQEISGTATVAGDPRTGLSAEALKANYDAAVEVGEMLTTTSEALTRLIEARDDIELLKEWAAKAKKASGEENDNQEEDVSEQAAADSTDSGEENGEENETPDNPYDAFIKEADATLEKLNELEKNIWTPPDTKGFVDTSYKLTSYIFTASFYVQSSYDAPSATAKAAMEEARRKLAERIGELDAIFAGDIANLRDQAAELELGVLRPVEPLGDS